MNKPKITKNKEPMIITMNYGKEVNKIIGYAYIKSCVWC